MGCFLHRLYIQLFIHCIYLFIFIVMFLVTFDYLRMKTSRIEASSAGLSSIHLNLL
jgi:hypothetical protein